MMIVVLSASVALAAPPEDGKNKQAPPAEKVDWAEALGAALVSATHGAHDEGVTRRVLAIPKKHRRAMVPLLVDGLNHRDERFRRASAMILGVLKAGAAAKDLGEVLSDPSPAVVIAAARSLRQTSARGILKPLIAALSHPSVEVRCELADVLRTIRGNAAISALKEAGQRAELPEERACLLEARVRGGDMTALDDAIPLTSHEMTRDLGIAVLLLGKTNSLPAMAVAAADVNSNSGVVAAMLSVASQLGEPGLDWLAERLPEENPAIRRGALDMLLSKAQTLSVRKRLLLATGSGNAKVRARVIDALAGMKEMALVPLAKQWLNESSPEVRAAAARVFVSIPDKANGAMLLRAYQTERMRATDANLPVRVGLLGALGAIADPQWAAVFADASGVKGEGQAAVEAMVAVGEAAVRTLLLVVKVGDMERIPFALEGLARIGRGVGEAAESLFGHPKELVRELGRDLLAASGDPEAVKALVRLFRSETIEDPVPLIEAIAMFKTPEARAALEGATTHPNPAVRVAAVRGFAEGHDRREAAYKLITSLAETDTNDSVRLEALRALFRLGAPGVITLATKMVQYETPDVREQAYHVLGWAGDPVRVGQMAKRLRDAEGSRKVELQSALYRLTRRKDLKSERNYQEWVKKHQTAVTPAGGKRGTVKIGKRGAIHYREIGSGAAVIAIGGHHGGDIWASSLDRLKGTHRVVMVDARGRGRSTLWAPISLASEISDIEAVRAQLKIGRFTLVAHDDGGLVAAAYAKAHPKHVARLVLVGTRANGSRRGLERNAARKLNKDDRRILAQLDARHAWFPPAAWLDYRQFALAPGFVAKREHAALLMSHPSHALASQYLRRAIAGHSLAKLLKGLKVPTSVVVGDLSPLTSRHLADLKKLARARKAIRVHTLKGTGHYPQLEAPGWLNGHIGGGLAQN